MEKLPLISSKLSIYEYPRHMPGYTGHYPQERFTIGETYGNLTASWYKKYRMESLANSKERHGRGGDKHIPFPVYYQNEPSLVVGTKPRTHIRWAAAKKYSIHGENNEHLRKFKTDAEDHREYYKDQTGTVKNVKQFLLPNISHQTTPSWKEVDYP